MVLNFLTDLNKCREKPCKNGGICYNTEANQYRCECQAGFTGVNCETAIDFCGSSPCKNNGTCHNDASDFRCNCPPGWAGPTCEISKLNFAKLGVSVFIKMKLRFCTGIILKLLNVFFLGRDCQSRPCQNNGTCINNGQGYQCKCLPGWTGHMCGQG